jgi:gas vesicle protein
MTPSKHSFPSTPSPGYPNTNTTQENDLKSNLLKMIEPFQEQLNKSLKEIQENTVKQVEALKEEMNKSLKDIQETYN